MNLFFFHIKIFFLNILAYNFLKLPFTQALPKRKCRQKSVKEKRREVLFFRAKRIMPIDLLNFKFVLFAFKYRENLAS